MPVSGRRAGHAGSHCRHAADRPSRSRARCGSSCPGRLCGLAGGRIARPDFRLGHPAWTARLRWRAFGPLAVAVRSKATGRRWPNGEGRPTGLQKPPMFLAMAFSACWRDCQATGQILPDLMVLKITRVDAIGPRDRATLDRRAVPAVPAPARRDQDAGFAEQGLMVQRVGLDRPMSGSSAISGRVLPLVNAGRTASRRTSRVGPFRFPEDHLLVPRPVLSTSSGQVQLDDGRRVGGCSSRSRPPAAPKWQASPTSRTSTIRQQVAADTGPLWTHS